VKHGRQTCMMLVYSVLLTAMLNGCPGNGDGDVSRSAGAWQGTTSQGRNVSFVVANDNTITAVTAGAHITGASCTAADLSLSQPLMDERPHIVGNQFSVAVNPPVPAIFPPFVGITQIIMTGTFTNMSTAAGSLEFTANLAPSPCTGTATVTFQAIKQ